MGALAAAGCAWSARGLRVVWAWRTWLRWEVGGAGYRRERSGVARPMGAFSTGVRVDCGLSYTTVQGTIVARNDNNKKNTFISTMGNY